MEIYRRDSYDLRFKLRAVAAAKNSIITAAVQELKQEAPIS